MIVHLDETVGAALEAVAAVDDTDPASLAGMVLSDWLASHHERFARAAAALDRLANGALCTQRYVLGLDQDAEPVTADDQWDVAIDDGEKPDSGPRDEPSNDIPADGTPDPESSVDGHPCPDCDRVLSSPQGLGGHRAKVHPKAPEPQEKPEPEPDPVEDQDVDLDAGGEPTGRCAHCHGICLGRYMVEGEPACSSCWRDAGRPA